MYLGKILMGEAEDTLNVVYDTGSDWLVIPDMNCQSCNGNKHDNSNAEVVDEELSERLYGSAGLRGTTFKDKACLMSENEDSCVTDFEYFSFIDQYGIEPPIDGILGLSVGGQFVLLPDEEVEVGPLYIDALVK